MKIIIFVWDHQKTLLLFICYALLNMYFTKELHCKNTLQKLFVFCKNYFQPIFMMQSLKTNAKS